MLAWVRFRRAPVMVLAAGGAAVMLAGCASAQQPAVSRVATSFEDPSGDPQQRCDLLAPAALAAVEASMPCAQAIGSLPLSGGEVRSVQVWGGSAQVRLARDTVFLAETRAGWRITAAACQSRGEAPYDCEVEAP